MKPKVPPFHAEHCSIVGPIESYGGPVVWRCMEGRGEERRGDERSTTRRSLLRESASTAPHHARRGIARRGMPDEHDDEAISRHALIRVT